jgi:hypothetical protein
MIGQTLNRVDGPLKVAGRADHSSIGRDDRDTEPRGSTTDGTASAPELQRLDPFGGEPNKHG